MIQAFGWNDRTFNKVIHLQTFFHVFTPFAHVNERVPNGKLKVFADYGYRLITSQYSIVSFSPILYCRRMASVRPPYRASRVFKGLCLMIGWVSKSRFFSVILVLSNSHSHWILKLYPAGAICSIWSRCVRTDLQGYHQSLWEDPWTSYTGNRAKSNLGTRKWFSFRHSNRLHCRMSVWAICIPDCFSRVVFGNHLYVPCARATWVPSCCNCCFSCTRSRYQSYGGRLQEFLS
jgi:hypothetical protein